MWTSQYIAKNLVGGFSDEGHCVAELVQLWRHPDSTQRLGLLHIKTSAPFCEVLDDAKERLLTLEFA
jgi:hypothetical protein